MDSFWEKVEIIAAPFGGDAQECGEIGDDHVPLKFLLDQEARVAQRKSKRPSETKKGSGNGALFSYAGRADPALKITAH